ncbi:MAG: TetR/AcrR family transcriptional regulator [Polyangiales bacterium]
MNEKRPHIAAPPAEDSTQKSPPTRRRVRDRIFDTACRLFYEQGIRAVGVDAIAQEAGTNKMSFYRSFASKEELVAEYLRAQADEYWQWWDTTLAQYTGDPRRQAEALFDAYAPHAREYCPRGCALANAAVEICGEADARIIKIVCDYKSEIRRRLRALAHDMGAHNPDQLGDALMLLMEGGYSTSVAAPSDNGFLCAAAAAARALIDAHLHKR